MKRALELLASANDEKVGRVDSSPLYPHPLAPSLAVTDRSRPLCAGATNQGAGGVADQLPKAAGAGQRSVSLPIYLASMLSRSLPS